MHILSQAQDFTSPEECVTISYALFAKGPLSRAIRPKGGTRFEEDDETCQF